MFNFAIGLERYWNEDGDPVMAHEVSRDNLHLDILNVLLISCPNQARASALFHSDYPRVDAVFSRTLHVTVSEAPTVRTGCQGDWVREHLFSGAPKPPPPPAGSRATDSVSIVANSDTGSHTLFHAHV